MTLSSAGKQCFEQVDGSRRSPPGSVIFIERAVEHRFVDIIEDLTALVFFAPPEGSLKGGVEK